MKIIDLLNKKQNDLINEKPVTIAFLGDSVTQGCFECFITDENNGEIDTCFESKNSYSTRVKEILNTLYPKSQINIINSGISGDSTKGGLKRIERDIISYKPDLCIVSYGLNDTGCCTLEEYGDNLDKIFKKLKENNIETICLTQNAMCNKVSCHLTKQFFQRLACNFAVTQNSGKLTSFMRMAKEKSKENGVVVCDLYSIWEKMIESGVDTTELLANKLNHPIREYHYYIAIKLIETMFNN